MLDGLRVSARHTPLATPGERVVTAGGQLGVRPQQLYHVRATRHGWRRGTLCRQRARCRTRGGRRAASPQPPPATRTAVRSEEHTSELQSLMRISYAVFCLKKKKQNRKSQSHRLRTPRAIATATRTAKTFTDT